MQVTGELETLTNAQRRFADEVNAVIGSHCDGDAICLYREIPRATIRWIVDADGNVLDLVSFGH